ncbi:MAG: hypothetical protein HYW01_04235 [Deltaproteobacteria bacterium]|nr:hypothetical protein [Deltaproteobacteria bacterium]
MITPDPLVDNMEINQYHQRVITAGLYMLEKSIELIERLLIVQDREKITYRVNDQPGDKVRNSVLQDVEKMRKIIRELKDELNLKPREESIARNVRAEAAHIWEALCDMVSGELDRYGKTPKELADLWDPKVKELIEISLRIEAKVSESRE